MDTTIINIGLTLLGALISWGITHMYYKQSLKNQEIEASKQIKEWDTLCNNQTKTSKEALRLQYIEQGVAEYKRAGTPVRAINTFDIPNPKKAEIYDSIMMRVKGRLGKSNPYRD